MFDRLPRCARLGIDANRKPPSRRRDGWHRRWRRTPERCPTPMETIMNEQQPDGRMSFDEAVHYVQLESGKAAFSAMPVFSDRPGDAEQRAEGARVFVLKSDGAGSYCAHFIAGPFFSNAFAANETLSPAELPERIRELRFMATRLDDSWLGMQIQTLIQKLVEASGTEASQMPDYANMPAVSAGPEAVFPISFVSGRDR
ncbi:MAG: hypothetical protein PHY45_12765 [Rhodocyclaceae bacterium]|nr:hypothetical protein [Rhodocyclaceae bacterium]